MLQSTVREYGETGELQLSRQVKKIFEPFITIRKGIEMEHIIF